MLVFHFIFHLNNCHFYSRDLREFCGYLCSRFVNGIIWVWEANLIYISGQNTFVQHLLNFQIQQVFENIHLIYTIWLQLHLCFPVIYVYIFIISLKMISTWRRIPEPEVFSLISAILFHRCTVILIKDSNFTLKFSIFC